MDVGVLDGESEQGGTMERLTQRYGDNGVELVNDTIDAPGVAETIAMHRLADYEDTGLTPAGIAEMKERQRWIPVSERLPERGERVLMRMDVKSVYEGYINQSGEWDRYGNCIGTIEEFFGCNVTHWMPLPQPQE